MGAVRRAPVKFPEARDDKARPCLADGQPAPCSGVLRAPDGLVGAIIWYRPVNAYEDKDEGPWRVLLATPGGSRPYPPQLCTLVPANT